eukprot:TRINITY_DN35641_c0_g1_i1.p1 TRINITY_DN35641_c0_g1~~TRINITY_DN35641_c0_g1_i1.p1  ORF type:complete len:729 (+),score=95.22 TRINITY_DN35641_c0_g1_i1:257-2188(+)
MGNQTVPKFLNWRAEEKAWTKRHHEQHVGELEVQRRRHVPPEVSTIMPHLNSDEMPLQHSTFFSALPYFAIATTDAFGRPWATILVKSDPADGSMLNAASAQRLQVNAALPGDDPFAACIAKLPAGEVPGQAGRGHLWAGLGVDFTNRRRNKVAGVITSGSYVDKKLEMELITNENLGNCPKYITLRDLEYVQRTPETVFNNFETKDPVVLTKEEIDLVHRASTVFVATCHIVPNDPLASAVGLNHRGGPVGYSRVLQTPDQSYLILPDFSGNRFYSSLGNVQTDGLAGVVIPCFATGDMLYLTGEAVNLFDGDAEKIMPRMSLITKIRITGRVYIKGGLNLKLLSPETLSPYNPPVRYLASELKEMGHPVEMATGTTATLVNVEKRSQDISTFTFSLSTPVRFVPGGFAVFDFSSQFQKQYMHMNRANPQQVNDDHVRTWTISSTPPFDPETKSFQETSQISCTIKHVRNGAVSHLLHTGILPGTRLELPFFGVGGNFTCWDSKNEVPPKMVWIAAGVGITPFFAFLASLKAAGKSELDVLVMIAARGEELAAISSPFKASPLVSRLVLFDSTAGPTSALNIPAKASLHGRRMEADDLFEVEDLEERVVFICGPERFMADATEWLVRAKVPADNIKKESFNF